MKKLQIVGYLVLCILLAGAWVGTFAYVGRSREPKPTPCQCDPCPCADCQCPDCKACPGCSAPQR